MTIYNLLCRLLRMVKEGEGTLTPVGRARTRYLVIPAAVASDSAFPFRDGQRVRIAIEGERLVVTKKK